MTTDPTPIPDQALPTTGVVHTVDEALDRFELVNGAGNQESTACVMTAISWMTGAAWTDAPPCAHQTLRTIAIRANDATDTTPQDRAAILRAGAAGGLIDTWWIPNTVVAAAIARPKPPEGQKQPPETRVDTALRALAAIQAWKALGHPEPDLQGAYLQGAYLQGADLRRAYLQGAYLQGADLRRAYLQGADLQGAYLQGVDLQGAYLRRADLQGAFWPASVPAPAGWTCDPDSGRLAATGKDA